LLNQSADHQESIDSEKERSALHRIIYLKFPIVTNVASKDTSYVKCMTV